MTCLRSRYSVAELLKVKLEVCRPFEVDVEKTSKSLLALAYSETAPFILAQVVSQFF